MTKRRSAYILAAACLIVILCMVGWQHVRTWHIKQRNRFEETACLGNHVFLNGMIRNWKSENGLTNGAPIDTNAFVARFFPSDGLPWCPSGGDYDLGVVGGTVKCSVHVNLSD